MEVQNLKKKKQIKRREEEGGTGTIVEELHAEREFTFEGVDLEAFLLQAADEILELVGLVQFITQRLEEEREAAGLPVYAELIGRRIHL